MNYHKTPIMRRRWVAVSLALVIVAAAWLTRAAWPPLVSTWGKQLLAVTQVWGGFVQSLADLLAIVVLVGGGAAAWLGLRSRAEGGSQAEGDRESPLPLRQVTPQALLEEKLGNGAAIQWVDRGAIDVGDLLRTPRLIILGPSRIGKTREALELIRRATHDDQVSRQRVYEPNYQDVRFLTGDGLGEAIRQGISPDQPVLLFVDEFTRLYVTEAELARLATALTVLRGCKRCYVVMTGRDDQLTAAQENWLVQYEVRRKNLGGLADPLMAAFVQNTVDALGQDASLDITAGARQRLVALARGMPEHARQTLLRLRRQGVVEVDDAAVAAVGQATVNELWVQTRGDLERQMPAARYLLDALGVFHAARVTPRPELVLAYAGYLWRRSGGPWLAWRRWRDLADILVKLAVYEIRVVDSLIQYPDQVVAEAPAAEPSREALARFLRGYRRWAQNRWLRRWNRLWSAQLWAWFDLGLAYQAEKRFELAIGMYTAAGRVAPHWLIYNNRGVAYADAGNQAAAIADYDRAIAIDPQFATVYSNRGAAYADSGDWAAAIVDLDRAIALLPDGPDKATAYTNRGLAYADSGDWAAAIADYDRAIALTPLFATVYNNRGAAYAVAGDRSAAIADLDRAIALNPQEAMAYYNRGAAYAAAGDRTAAIADYDRAIALLPDGPDKAKTYNNRGAAYAAAGDRAAAIADYDRAIALDPQFATAYYNRGATHGAVGDRAAAITDYNRVIALDPQFAMAYNNRGATHGAVGDRAAAITDYDRAITLLPDGPDKATAYYNRGAAYAAAGDRAAAIADYDRAIPLFSDGPDKAKTYSNRGVAYLDSGDGVAAITDFDRAIALLPDGPDKATAYCNRGLAYAAAGDRTAAIADYDRVIALNPQYALAYNNRGLAHAEAGDRAAAIADYDRAIALDPQFASAYNNRGNAHVAAGDRAAAIADYGRAIVLLPDGPDKATAYTNRGTAHADSGDRAAAIADYDCAIVLLLDGPDKAGIMQRKGSALREMGEWAAAKGVYEAATALEPEAGYDWLGLADAAREVGDEAGYREALARATVLLAEASAYDRACLASVSGDVAGALELLAEALAEDPGQREGAREDPDLRRLRGEERFWELVGRE